MLNEKKLVKKIARLKEIRPDENWVSFIKGEILGEEKKEKETLNVFGWLFNPIKNPVWAVRGVIMSVLVLVGFFFYWSYQNNQAITEVVLRNQVDNGVFSSINNLQENLEKINVSLNNLKNVGNKNQALVMTEVIKATAIKGEEAIEEIKRNDGSLSKESLASLNDLGKSYQELQRTSNSVQREMIEFLLSDIKGRSLTPEEESYLEKAREAYNKGKDGEAVIFLSKIGD